MATGTAAVTATHRKLAVRGDADQRIEAIGRDAEAEPQSVVGMPTGGRFPEDPFAGLQRVAGWVVDYVAFLREPIDQLQGDPQGVQATADAIRSAAERMRELARKQGETLAEPQGWTGQAQEAYQVSMDALGQELGTLAEAVAKKGVVVEHSGGMVRALREAVLYSVGQYSDSLVAGAMTAYVFAPVTFGASIAIYLGSVVASASQLGSSIAGKMDDLNAALTRQVDRVEQLDGICDEVGQGWERFGTAAGGETAQRALAPMRQTSEALRPMHAVAAEREPMAYRQAVQAEPMVEAHRAVQAEPMVEARQAVRGESAMRAAYAEAPVYREAQPLMHATRADAPVYSEAQPLMHATRADAPVYSEAQPLMHATRAEVREVSPTHQVTVHRVSETE